MMPLPLSHGPFMEIDMGLALLIVGILSLTLGVSWAAKNFAAGITWGFSFISLIVAGIWETGMEIFWMLMIATGLLIMVGFVVRWSK